MEDDRKRNRVSAIGWVDQDEGYRYNDNIIRTIFRKAGWG